MLRTAMLAGLVSLALPSGAPLSIAAVPETPPIPVTSHAVFGKDYPQVARQLGEEGEVTIRYLVGADGKVTECQIVMSSNEPRLDITACLLARRNWKFKPATRDGKPVAAYLEGMVLFQLSVKSL